jgi:hypothetical protein
MLTTSQAVNFSNTGFSASPVKFYSTSATRDLTNSTVSDLSKVDIEPRSIITFVGNYE